MNILANATPKSKAGKKLPMNMHVSHNLRQDGLSTLLLNSSDTPRSIKANKINIKGEYNVLNMIAYVFGKAAKVTPPAVINQTSLPSQNGPMAL
jgi:tRNA pseudouridine-54 N-methylase